MLPTCILNVSSAEMSTKSKDFHFMSTCSHQKAVNYVYALVYYMFVLRVSFHYYNIILNLAIRALLFGLSEAQAKASVSHNCRAMLLHAGKTRSSHVDCHLSTVIVICYCLERKPFFPYIYLLCPHGAKILQSTFFNLQLKL